MKLLVCISQTPDTTAKVSFKSDGKEFDAAGVQFIMNPYDEWYALVRACELREALGGSVTALNVGLAANETTIRKSLAIGARPMPLDAPVMSTTLSFTTILLILLKIRQMPSPTKF